MKKMFIVFAVIASMLVGVCPVNAVKNEAIFEVRALGIIRGDENGDLHLDSDVTRAEFVAMVSRMLGYDDITDSMDCIYKDVDDTNIFRGQIALMSGLGYISGDGNGYFRPDEPIIMQDCLKILVNAVGYSMAAQNGGGYPTGYIAAANRLELTKNLTGTMKQNATRGDVVSMIYQALHVDIMEKDYSTKNEYKKSGETLLDRFKQRDDVMHTTGVITANSDTWLVRPLSDIKENEIEIDNVRYNCGNLNLKSYIGMTVEVYYREESSGEKMILNIAESNKNNKISVKETDVDSIKKDELIYHTSGNKKQTAKFDADVVFVYNGRMLTDCTEDDIRITSGRYDCVDNNDDKRYDYVFIYEYESSVVDRVNVNGCIYVKNDLLIDGIDYVRVELENDDFTYIIKDASGASVNLDEIKKDDVITVYKSLNGQLVEIVVSDNRITGVIEATDDDNIVIDGNEYGQYSKINRDDISLGVEVTAYINELGEVVYVDESENSDYKYGYIIGTEKKGISKAKVKILVSDLVKNDTELDENSDDEDYIPVLLCKNSEVIIVELESKVKFDKERLSADNAMEKMDKLLPVKFKLNSNGKLSSVEYLELEYGSTAIKTDYNAKDRTFGGITGILPFGVNDKTQVICIPDNASPSNDDMLSQIKIDNRDASIRYLASGYERDENTKCVKLLVIIADMSSDTALNITKNSDIAVVQKSVFGSDDMGMDEQRVIVMTGEGELELKVKDIEGNGDTANLKTGDFIIYELNNEGYLVNSKIFKSLGKSFINGVSNRGSVNGCITGTVTEIEKNEINNEKNKRVHIVTVQAGDLSYRVEFPARNIPNFYVYDKESKSARIGSIDDVMYGDTVCVAMPEENIKDCVVLRGN